MKTSFFHKILFYINIAVAIALIASYIAPFVSPLVFWPLAFFGLAFPVIFLINIGFVILWGFLGSKRFFLSLILLIMGYKAIPNHFQIDLEESTIPGNSMKLVSFNVRVFDLYMWTEEKSTRNAIFDFLDQEDADIVCLQEFYNSTRKNPNYEFKTLDTLKQFLRAKNYHVDYSTTLRGTDNWGLITFSAYPIVKRGKVSFPVETDNTCIYTDIVKGEDTIRVYNMHLASIRLDKKDYKSLREIRDNNYSQELKREIEIMGKLKAGFQMRALQADAIAESIKNCPYKIIICGDFNDTPSSYAYRRIRGSLKDAFVEKGSGMGKTYNGKLPSFRIDYIFHSPEINTYTFDNHKVNLSDHFPISATLK